VLIHFVSRMISPYSGLDLAIILRCRSLHMGATFHFAFNHAFDGGAGVFRESSSRSGILMMWIGQATSTKKKQRSSLRIH